MDIIEPIEPEQVLSENPAIFETEPKDIKELDIYYEGSAPVPISFGEDNVHEAFPIGSYIDNEGIIFTVTDYIDKKIQLDKNPNNATSARNLESGSSYIINRPDGLSITILILDTNEDPPVNSGEYYIQVKENLYWNLYHSLGMDSNTKFGGPNFNKTIWPELNLNEKEKLIIQDYNLKLELEKNKLRDLKKQFEKFNKEINQRLKKI